MAANTTTQILKEEADKAHVKRIWKAFWILLILTIFELALGLLIYNLDKGDPSYMLIIFIKGVITILTIAKAFYIISIFMHLGDEIRSMMLSLALPAALFIWFITAFLADGTSFKNLRNTNAGSRVYIEQKNPIHAPPKVIQTIEMDKKLD